MLGHHPPHDKTFKQTSLRGLENIIQLELKHHHRLEVVNLKGRQQLEEVEEEEDNLTIPDIYNKKTILWKKLKIYSRQSKLG
jgi:hypothetical protein